MDPQSRVLGAARLLVGGSPRRLLRLSAAGAERVAGWGGGQPVGEDPASQRLARRLIAAGIAHPVPGPGPFTTADVRIVVPVRDRADGLRRTLDAIGQHPGEIVVVDDGSRVPLTVPAGASPARVLRHDRARGPAAARNAGAAGATKPVLAFVDSDCRPAAGWLDPLLGHLASVGAAAPRVVSAPGGTWLARYEAARSPLDLGPLPGVVRAGTRIGYVPAAALVVRRDAFEAVGGFDESLRTGEDVDLVWRLKAAGHPVRYEPAATVRHDHRATVRGLLAQRVGYGRSAAPLARRHPAHLAPARLSSAHAVVWILALAGYPAAAVAAASASAVATTATLRAHGVPPAEAARLVVEGHVAAGKGLAQAATRVWWPLLLPSRRGRAVLAVAALVRDPRRIVDDAAYGLGLWVGCVAERTADPLVPRIGGHRDDVDG